MVKEKVNLIFNITDLRIIPDIMRMIKISKVEGVNYPEMEHFLYKNLGSPDTKLWIAFDGDKINGFVLAYVVYPIVTPEIFVAWAYIDPKVRKAGKDLMASVENWAKSLKIRKISALVRENLDAFQKKYGFKLEYYCVAKEIPLKGEDDNERNVQV